MEEEKKFTIYLHRCPNGKCYVGMTSQKVSQRWRNGLGYKNNKDFYPDIKRYGWDNIEHIILEEGLNKEDACESEKYNIKKYNCIYPNGYNIAIGGEVSWNLGKHLPKEVREKISKSNMGKKMSKEFCEKRRQYVLQNLDKYPFIGKSLCGEDNPNYGNHKLLGSKMTKEQKEKLSNSLRSSEKMKKYHNSNRGENNPNYGKKWTQEEKERISKKIIYANKIYPSISKFCEELKLDRNLVGAWLNKRRPMPKKYIDNGLKFYDDMDIQYEPNRFKKVICDEKEFYTIIECANYYNEDGSKMARWLSGRDNMPKKFIELNLHFDGENKKYTEQIFNEKMVIMDNMIFKSINQLGKYTNGASSKFSIYLSNKKPMPQKWKDRGLRYYNPETDSHLPIYVDTKDEV